MSKTANFVHKVLFGKKNLAITNTAISAVLGALGDAVVQHYDIMTHSSFYLKRGGAYEFKDTYKGDVPKFNYTRTLHMTITGITTGAATHYWYVLLDKYIGVKRTFSNLVKKILLDQVLYGPVCIAIYFATLAVCEKSDFDTFWNEFVDKGLKNIYVAELIVWPPMQVINFTLIPLRYRMTFDNVISFGFDVYFPYVKYMQKREEEQKKRKENSLIK